MARGLAFGFEAGWKLKPHPPVSEENAKMTRNRLWLDYKHSVAHIQPNWVWFGCKHCGTTPPNQVWLAYKHSVAHPPTNLSVA